MDQAIDTVLGKKPDDGFDPHNPFSILSPHIGRIKSNTLNPVFPVDNTWAGLKKLGCNCMKIGSLS
jgi:hypothetical protein